MGIRQRLISRVASMFGERLGLRGSFGRLPERRLFELTKEEEALICLAGAKTVHPAIVRARQNAVWSNIARAHRFDVRSVQPHPEKPSPPYFTAVPLPDDERDGGVVILDVEGPR